MTTTTIKPRQASSGLWENVKTILYALALAMLIRFVIAQPFRIPSGSMQPTLMVGDYIVVTKWSYGYSRFSVAPFQGLVPVSGRLFSSEPKRGDIVVFRPERQQDRDLIKRLIGMPGDRIQVRDGAVFINDEPIARESLGARPFKQADGSVIDIQAYKETLPNGVNYITFDRESAGVFDTTPVFVVPEGRYFFMGDDRDNSDDSRGSVGYVPIDHLVGKAQFVFISFDHIVPRADRLLKGLN
ncbi:MAG: signal peptidase I [Caulobacterales bacterium]|jgi:signal peptidase I